MSTFGENEENQQDLNFSQDNNVVPKKSISKRRSDYSNTKVKTRNLLTNVAYWRFKQSDFNNKSFIIDILSFLVQNFNPVNLDIKLDIDKERDIVKFVWDECILYEFVSFLYKEKQYNEISQTNLTYQKANNIVKEYLFEDSNRINHLKFKTLDKFDLIHYVYSLLFSKIYNRTNNFGIKRKNNFDFNFQMWKKKKMQNNVRTFNSSLMQSGSLAKNPDNYNRVTEKIEQQPIDFSINEERPTMVYSITQKDDEEIVLKNAEKRKILEKKLEENTLKMKKIKKK